MTSRIENEAPKWAVVSPHANERCAKLHLHDVDSANDIFS